MTVSKIYEHELRAHYSQLLLAERQRVAELTQRNAQLEAQVSELSQCNAELDAEYVEFATATKDLLAFAEEGQATVRHLENELAVQAAEAAEAQRHAALKQQALARALRLEQERSAKDRHRWQQWQTKVTARLAQAKSRRQDTQPTPSTTKTTPATTMAKIKQQSVPTMNRNSATKTNGPAYDNQMAEDAEGAKNLWKERALKTVKDAKRTRLELAAMMNLPKESKRPSSPATTPPSTTPATTPTRSPTQKIPPRSSMTSATPRCRSAKTHLGGVRRKLNL